MTGTDPYSTRRIASGAVYLIGGKAVSALASIGTFMLLVRGLPVEEFAAYTILFALTELVDATTGIGLIHVLGRYVPELLVEHRQHALRRLILVCLAIRAAVIAGVLGVAWLLSSSLAPRIGLDSWHWALQAYLLVVFARIVSMALFSVLEAMLRQKIAQIGASSVTLARFGLLAVASHGGGLDLQTVILIELATDVFGVCIALIGTLRATGAIAGRRADEDADWLRANRRRMLEFGLKGYLQHMLIMPYNGSTARVLTGSALSAPEMALFGFAQGFSDLIGRYLPVNLFSGIVRPVLTARYVRDGRFQDIVATSNLMFKVSGAISLLIAVAVYSGGAPMLTLATNGKYGDGHVGLLLLICAVVFMYAFRMSLDQVCNAVERNGPLIWSNVVITSSVLPGILLLPIVGVYALPLSTLGGLVVGCIVLHWRLKVGGFQYRHDFPGLARLGAAVVFAMLAADATRWAGAPWQLALVAGIVSYIVAVLVLRPASTHDRNIVRAILRRQ